MTSYKWKRNPYFCTVLKSLIFLLRYFLFWFIIFTVSRTVFILFNLHDAAQFSFGELIATYVHGLMLDISTICYLLIFPFIHLVTSQFIRHKIIKERILAFYSFVMVILVVFISTADAELYRFWGQKLNAYATSFARFPKQMLASSGVLSLAKIVLAIFIQLLSANVLYRLLVRGKDVQVAAHHKWIALLSVPVVSVVIFVGIRGGWGKAAVNQSSAYYSSHLFLNHTAVNSSWNLMSSFINSADGENTNPYHFIDNTVAGDIVDSLYKTNSTSFPAILNAPKPNLLLIILEGWDADVIEPLGGETGVTPQLNSMVEDGILFTHFYSSGNRTDKGLASILSAQPSLAKSSIINKIEKFTDLPSLCKSLTDTGYSSMFVYGGESIFANMKGYWFNAGFQKIIDLNDFPVSERNSEWGVHDEFLYNRILNEAGEMKQPFFLSTITLSSHEPFKVPVTKFAGSDDPQLYRNAVYYSDSCLGVFIQYAKKQSWYNNTLIVITSDHGHQWPKDRKSYDPERFHIPLLITGGAVKNEFRGKIILKTGSQTDIATTLLTQFGMHTKQFNWGKNLLNSASLSFATYTYNDGIGLVSDSCVLVYDQETKRVIFSNNLTEIKSGHFEKTARSYEQVYYNEFLMR